MLKQETLGVSRRRGAAEEEEEEEEGRGANAPSNKRKKTTADVEEEEVSRLPLAVEQLSSCSRNETGDQAPSTAAFLSFSNLLLLVLDKLGPAMGVLRQDVRQNIERLEELQAKNPSLYSNLPAILIKEREEGTARKPHSCSRAVVWLTRSVDFSAGLMGKLAKEPQVSLRQAVEEAYDCTMKPWHGWISSAAYRVALKLLPDRTSFVRLFLKEEEDESLFEVEVEKLLVFIRPLLDQMHFHLREFKLEKLKSE